MSRNEQPYGVAGWPSWWTVTDHKELPPDRCRECDGEGYVELADADGAVFYDVCRRCDGTGKRWAER